MQTKLNRLLIIALFAQLGLLAATRIFSEAPTQNTAVPLFPALKADAIEGITVEDDKGQKVDLGLVSGNWVVTSAANYATKKDKATSLLAKLFAARVRQPAATKSHYHRKLEVAADTFQRKVSLRAKGGTSTSFLLGSSAGLRSVHLRLSDKEETYKVSDLTSWDFGAEARDWVDTQYFKLDREGVVQIELKNAAGDFKLLKSPAGKWALAGIGTDEALNEAEVDSLLSSVAYLHFSAPVGKELKPEYGFATPRALLKITTQKDAPATKTAPKSPASTEPSESAAASQPAQRAKIRMTDTLLIGAENDGSCYVKGSNSDYVVRISTANIDVLVKKKRSDLLQKATAKTPSPPN